MFGRTYRLRHVTSGLYFCIDPEPAASADPSEVYARHSALMTPDPAQAGAVVSFSPVYETQAAMVPECVLYVKMISAHAPAVFLHASDAVDRAVQRRRHPSQPPVAAAAAGGTAAADGMAAVCGTTKVLKEEVFAIELVSVQECMDAHFVVSHRKLLHWPAPSGRPLRRLVSGLRAFVDFSDGASGKAPAAHAAAEADGTAAQAEPDRCRRQSYMRQLGVADVVLEVIKSPSSQGEAFRDLVKVAWKLLKGFLSANLANKAHVCSRYMPIIAAAAGSAHVWSDVDASDAIKELFIENAPLLRTGAFDVRAFVSILLSVLTGASQAQTYRVLQLLVALVSVEELLPTIEHGSARMRDRSARLQRKAIPENQEVRWHCNGCVPGCVMAAQRHIRLRNS
jgi:hypothetical protein